MKKLRLNLEQLTVVSFAPGLVNDGRGTVRGHYDKWWSYVGCTPEPQQPFPDTWQGGLSCDEPCI